MQSGSSNSRGRSDTELRYQQFPRTPQSYLAGQFASAQAMLHGQRLRHVRNRLVDLLQVAFVLHLNMVLSDIKLPDQHLTHV